MFEVLVRHIYRIPYFWRVWETREEGWAYCHGERAIVIYEDTRALHELKLVSEVKPIVKVAVGMRRR